MHPGKSALSMYANGYSRNLRGDNGVPGYPRKRNVELEIGVMEFCRTEGRASGLAPKDVFVGVVAVSAHDIELRDVRPTGRTSSRQRCRHRG